MYEGGNLLPGTGLASGGPPPAAPRQPHGRRPRSRTDRPVLWAVLLISLPVADGGAQQWPGSWMRPAAPVRIAENLYYVGTEGLAAYLVTSSLGHVLIDAPLEANVPHILASIRTLGFDPRDVRILLHSHAHADHVGGLAAMQEATGAELLIHDADAMFVATGRNFGLPPDAPGYPPATATRSVAHLDTVRVGEIALTAHLTPGHTPGCTTWSGSARIDGESFTFVIVCSLTVLRGYRLVGPDATYPGQGEDFCRSLAHLETLAPAIFLAPHAGWFNLRAKRTRLDGGEVRAFVDPDGYRTWLARAREWIERALTAQGHEGGCDTLID